MRIRRRPESRLGGQPAVHLPLYGARDRTVVLGRDFHEQIVLMLSICDRLAITLFSRREEVGVSAPPDGPWLEAEHAAKPQATTREIAVRHSHEPVDAAELIMPTVAAVIQKLRE